MKFKELKDFPYTSSFASIQLKPIVTEEADKYLALASLEQVKSFIPTIKEGNCDLLPVAFNACVVNRVNKNDDVISTETALASYKNFLYKQINLEHNRKNVVGVILSAGFSEFGTDKPLTEEDVKGSTKPFNITLGGVVWRIVNDNLADFIEESNDPTSPYYLQISASWEVGFTDYKLAVIENGKKNLEDALIISDATEISKFKNLLKAYQGTGRVDESKRIYRVPTNDFIPLGVGLTEKPAAEVQGIATNTETTEEAEAAIPPQFLKKKDGEKPKGKDEEEEDTNEEKPEGEEETEEEKKKKAGKNKNFPPKKKDSKDGEEIPEDKKKKGNDNEDVTVNVTVQASDNNNQKNISQAIESNVNEGRTVMIKTLKDITDESLKQCTAATIAEVVQNHLTEKAQEWAKEKTSFEDQLKQAKADTQKTTEDFSALKKQFDEVQAKINTLETEKVEREKVEKFNSRMSEIVAAYVLDDEARAAVVEEVKAVASDEDFEKYKKRAAVLLKGFAKKTDENKGNKGEEAAASVVETAINNGTQNNAALPNSTTGSQKKTLAELAQQAFAKDNFTVNYR
jgi:hypothetical protein